jgi:hypothetical protein
MARWKDFGALGSIAAAMVMAAPLAGAGARLESQAQAKDAGALSPAYLDQLLAPVALYPDQLLAQILLCSGNPSKVVELGAWLKQMSTLKGSALQEAASKAGFEPSFVALAPFPQVVDLMAGSRIWTSQLGGAFATDRGAVFESIQRLRKQSQAAGNLKSTPQQTVETQTTKAGEQVIVIEPANPQVVYVPQYNPQVVYTQAAPTTVVVQDDDDDAAVAGAVIGFAAGIAIGAAIDNNYYYGPYGWHGGVHMYNDAWDDWYDDREDAREDVQDRREDVAGERSERAEDAREQRGERSEGAQQQRTERQQSRSTPEAQAQRGSGERSSARSAERSGTRSDAFSGYSSGSSTRAASSRGERSRSGGGRSRKR